MVKFKNGKTGIRKFGKLEKHSSKNWNIRKIGSCANEWTPYAKDLTNKFGQLHLSKIVENENNTYRKGICMIALFFMDERKYFLSL